MNEFYYVYVLLSDKDNKFYTGFASNLKRRFEEHCKGYVESTKNRRPLILIYYSPSEMLHRSNPDASGLFHRVKPAYHKLMQLTEKSI